MTHNKEKNKSIETDTEMTVNRKYLKTIIIINIPYVQEGREKLSILNRDIENTKITQIWYLEK